MLRVRLIAVISAIGIAGVALAGCSSSSSPDWLKPSPPAPQALQFESEPPGATVQTTQGQTCTTPCTLTLPVVAQQVTFAMNGYVQQPVPLSVQEPEHSFFNSKPPELEPNPVTVQLLPAPAPPRPVRKPRPHRVAAKPRPPAAQPAIAAPEPAGPPPQDNAFPPPPPMQPSASPFPPPPTR